MLKIALYTQKKDKETERYIQRFLEVLERKKLSIFLFNEMQESFNFHKSYQAFRTKQDLQENGIDYFFSFGGDGTILSTLNLIQNLEIPIIGVNLGRLGFLASFTQESVLENLDQILAGEMNFSRRSVIEIQAENIDCPYALNDVTITRKEITSMITVEAEIDGEFLSFFWGDGLIVATPTGSTAYSLSCGGPIIEPNNDNFSLTPIAPHNLNMRPIILKDNVKIKLKVSSRVPKYFLGLDSRLYHMKTENELLLRKADFSFCIVFPKETNFYETLRQKLLWGNDKRN